MSLDKKDKLGLALIGISVVLMFFSTTDGRSFGYVLGALLPKLIVWTIILGAIAAIASSASKKSFVYIFGIIFIIAAVFDFGSSIVDKTAMKKAREQALIELMREAAQEKEAQSNTPINRPNKFEGLFN